MRKHEEPARTPDLREHMLTTYKMLRWALFSIGIALPLVLASGGFAKGMPLQDSISQYYHADRDYRPTVEERALVKKATSIRTKDTLTEAERAVVSRLLRPGAGTLRNWFVGLLFMTAVLLITYKGFLADENIALNLAGLFAVGVALFPMPWGPERGLVDRWLASVFELLPLVEVPSFHYVCAVLFFMSLAYVCFFCGSATLDVGGETGALDKEQIRRFSIAYKVCGGIMVAAPVGGLFLSHIPTLQHNRTFLIEVIGVAGFAAYWILKSRELAMTQADRLAAEGKLEVSRSRSAFTGNKVHSRSAPVPR